MNLTTTTSSSPGSRLSDIKLSAVQGLKATAMFQNHSQRDISQWPWPTIKEALGDSSPDPAEIRKLNRNLKSEKAEMRRLTGVLATHWDPIVRLQEYCRQHYGTLTDADKVELQINRGVQPLDQLQLTASCPAKLNLLLHRSALAEDRLFQIATFNKTDDPGTFARERIAELYQKNPMPNVDRDNLVQWDVVMIRSRSVIHYYTVKDTTKVKCGFCGRKSKFGWIHPRLGYGSCSTNRSRPSICEVLNIISNYHPNNKSKTTATKRKISAAMKQSLEVLTPAQKKQRMAVPNAAYQALPEEVRAMHQHNGADAFIAKLQDPVYYAEFSAKVSIGLEIHYSDPEVCAAMSARLKLKYAADPKAIAHLYDWWQAARTTNPELYDMWYGNRWSWEQRIQQAEHMIRHREALLSIASTVVPASEDEIYALLNIQADKFSDSRWEEVTLSEFVAKRPNDMHIREFVDWFRQSWDYMVGPGGTIHTSDITNNIYPKDDPFSYASILARDDLRPGQIVNYRAKLEIHKSAIIGYLYNAKPIGENCGNDARFAICHMGQYKVNVTANVPVPIDEDDEDEGDPKLCDAFSFCYNSPYSSGESMLLTLACGGADAYNASRTEEIIRRGAGVMASLHRKHAEAEANQQPVFRFFRDTWRDKPHVALYTKRILGGWPVYQTPDVEEALNAPLRISVKDGRMHAHAGSNMDID